MQRQAPITDTKVPPIKPLPEIPIIPKAKEPTMPPIKPIIILVKISSFLVFIILPARYPAKAPVNNVIKIESIFIPPLTNILINKSEFIVKKAL